MNALKYAFLFLSLISLYSGINARNIHFIIKDVLEELIAGPCEAVTFVEGGPCFWMCGNDTLIPSRCRDALNTSSFKGLTFCRHNINYHCLTLDPKVAIAKSYHIKDDQIIVCITVCLSFAFTAVTMITFLMRREKFKRDMKEIIVFNNLCWIIVSICWIVQFFSRARTEIYKKDDGAIQHLFELDRYICGISFVFLYYFSMAGVVWFVILTYSWYSFPERGAQKIFLQKNKYFHICAWCIPLFLTVTMAITQARGICFRVSNMNMGIILANMAYLLGGYFLTLSIFNAVKEMRNNQDVESRQNFRHKMLHRGFIAICLVMLCSITFSCQVYDFNNREEWNNSSQDYVHCLSKNSSQSSWSDAESSNLECVLKSKPNVFVFVIHMLSFMIFGNMVSSLFWNKYFLNVFKYYFCSCCAKYCDGLKSNFTPPPNQLPPTPPNKRRSLKKGTEDTFDVILFSPGTPATLLLSDVNDCSFSCEA